MDRFLVALFGELGYLIGRFLHFVLAAVVLLLVLIGWGVYKLATADDWQTQMQCTSYAEADDIDRRFAERTEKLLGRRKPLTEKCKAYLE